MNNISYIKPFQLKTNDKIQIELKNLYQNCFDDSSSYIDFYFKEKIKSLQTSYLLQNEKIVSALYLKPQQISFHNHPIPAQMICGASTHPDYTHQGLMRRLLTEVFQELYQANIPLVTLHPFNDKFYQKFGFIPYTFYQMTESQKSKKYLLKPATTKDIPTLLALYQEFVSGYDIYHIRTEADFQAKFSELASDGDEIIIISNKNNDVYGYYITVEGIVEEYCFLDQFITRKNEYIERVSNHHHQTLNMARIINPLPLLKGYTYQTNNFNMSFKIIDDIIPNNNMIINLAIEDNVTLSNSHDYQFEITIQNLATLLLVGNIYNNPHPFYQLFKLSKNISWEKY